MRPGLLVVAALLGALATAPARAQEPVPPSPAVPLAERGCCLDDVPDDAQIDKLRIEGNSALSSSLIENSIYTTENGFFPWSDRHYLDEAEFLNDLQRIHVLYQRYGYFDAVLASYAVRETSPDEVEVVLTIFEGEPTQVDSLDILGLEASEGRGPTHGEPTAADLLDRMPMKEGEIFTEVDLIASRDTLENAHKNNGHAFADVLLEYRIRKDAHSAVVAYTVVPGDLYYFGDLKIEGYPEADAQLIQRQLAFHKGELYSRNDVLESQRRIYELSLFQRVAIEPQLASLRGDTVDVVVTVVPAPPHVVRIGVGYGTEDRVRLRASWLNRNLFGEGRQLEVRGQYSQLEREGAVTYRQPYFFKPDLNLLGSAFLRFEIEPNYTVQRVGATGRLGYRVNRFVQARAGLTVERDKFSAFDSGVLIPEFGREFINPSRLLFADMGATYDNTDSLFTPTRGFTSNLTYQAGLPLVGADYAYHRLTFQITHYRQVRPGWVIAAKILPGAIFLYGGEKARVPLFQRLFAGGANSVRGYARRQLGPKDDPAAFGQDRDPEPIGGRGLLETSVELRFPVRGNFRGAVFVDAGNVWDDPGAISPGDLKVTPGAGIRYTTPVGPLRIDVARRLASDEPFLPNWVFHISIGNAF
ncbi:MAG: outer membrane protein assembly factor BamA [Gemmatimonadota bacterium]